MAIITIMLILIIAMMIIAGIEAKSTNFNIIRTISTSFDSNWNDFFLLDETPFGFAANGSFTLSFNGEILVMTDTTSTSSNQNEIEILCRFMLMSPTEYKALYSHQNIQQILTSAIRFDSIIVANNDSKNTLHSEIHIPYSQLLYPVVLLYTILPSLSSSSSSIINTDIKIILTGSYLTLNPDGLQHLPIEKSQSISVFAIFSVLYLILVYLSYRISLDPLAKDVHTAMHYVAIFRFVEYSLHLVQIVIEQKNGENYFPLSIIIIFFISFTESFFLFVFTYISMGWSVTVQSFHFRDKQVWFLLFAFTLYFFLSFITHTTKGYWELVILFELYRGGVYFFIVIAINNITELLRRRVIIFTWTQPSPYIIMSYAIYCDLRSWFFAFLLLPLLMLINSKIFTWQAEWASNTVYFSYYFILYFAIGYILRPDRHRHPALEIYASLSNSSQSLVVSITNGTQNDRTPPATSSPSNVNSNANSNSNSNASAIVRSSLRVNRVAPM